VYYNYTGDDVDDIRETTEVYKISKKEIRYKKDSVEVSEEGSKVVSKEDFDPVIYSELLYNESDKCFYILLIEQLNVGSEHEGVTETEFNYNRRTFLVPRIYKFDTSSYSMDEILYPYDCVFYNTFIENKLHETEEFSLRMFEKDTTSKANIEIFNEILTSVYFENGYENLSNWEIPYSEEYIKLKDVTFSYNNNLQSYLIAYTLQDDNGTPFLYQHKFKLGDIDTFNDTM
jgi:hypothetical protein